MVAVIVERVFGRPVSLDVLVESDRRARWCLDLHGGRALFQSIATDGLSSLCVYEAPDAEAMRRVAESVRVNPDPVIWAATTHLDPDSKVLSGLLDGESTFGIVDRSFDAPREFAELQAAEDANSSCLVMYQVRFICSYLAFDKRRMACVYAAPDLEAIRSANRLTGLPFDDVRRAMAHT